MTYIYPIVVFDVDISSFANKISQNVFTTAFLSSHVQGSQLHGEEKKTTEVIDRLQGWKTGWFTHLHGEYEVYF